MDGLRLTKNLDGWIATHQKPLSCDMERDAMPCGYLVLRRSTAHVVQQSGEVSASRFLEDHRKPIREIWAIQRKFYYRKLYQ